MFETLTPPPPDKILALMQAFREDPRPEKIDLGVGVYRNRKGITPIMRAIKEAERLLWEIEETKAYTALAGEPAFRDAMAALVLGPALPEGRLASAATPGGTGAIRQGFELIHTARPEAKVWVSAPTWPNHVSILRHLGMPMAEYRYFDNATRDVDFAGMKADLARVSPGDVVLLHGCCHNPTGANLTETQWRELAELLLEREALPFVDIAYQGFGDGLDADAFGTRHLAERMPEMLIAASCSKNFGIYRERAGILMGVTADAERAPVLQATLAHLNRQNYSFPPDHGARLVSMVLADERLRTTWAVELEEMRRNMLAIREQLAEELRRRTNSARFDFIARHRGMFSRIGATPEQVAFMREKFAIYMVGDSRINIAGLTEDTVPRLAEAMIAAGM